MAGERTRVLGPRGLLVLLTGCALVSAGAPGSAAAQRPSPNPEELWRAYPLEQSPPQASAPEPPQRRAQPTEASHESWPRSIFGADAVAVGAFLGGGGLAILWLRRRRGSPALRAPLPAARAADATPSRSPPRRTPGALAPESCWIVCWRGTGQGVFYAVARDAEGHQQLIAESPAFTATPNRPLVLEGAAFDALQSLAARLSRSGWEAAAPVGARGAVWHAQEFRRKRIPAGLRR
jgi:hypothetical protein